MENPIKEIKDPDILAVGPALLRAVQKERELSIKNNTPFIVLKEGKVVDLNALPPEKK